MATVQSLGTVVFDSSTKVVVEIEGRRARLGEVGRVQSKRIFLTLAGLPRGLFTMEELIGHWRRIADLHEWIICKEMHADPTDEDNDVHFHCYMEAVGRFDSTSWYTFSIVKDGRRYFPQVLVCGAGKLHRQRLVEYVRKYGNVLQKLDGDVQYPSRTTIWDELRDVKSVREAKELVLRLKPQAYFKSWKSIKAGVVEMLMKEYEPQYTPDDFTLKIDIERLRREKKCLVLFGGPGFGKTQCALGQFEHPVLINNFDDLKKITEETDGLVFDEMDFGRGGLNLTGFEMIQLLDMDEGHSIKCRNVNAFIPAGMLKIFTTNKPMTRGVLHIMAEGACSEEQGGIERRYELGARVDHDLRIMRN